MSIINIYKAADAKSKLWRADSGKVLRDKISNEISINPVVDLLVLDLDKIDVMDTSYAREGFVKLIAEVGMDNTHPQILLRNVDEYVKQNLHLSFKDHKIFTLIVDQKKKWELIGKFSEQNLDTVKSLLKLKQTSAKQIARDLGDIGVTSAINRLNQLYQFCICTKKELTQPTGGKEFLFKMEL